MTATCDRRAAAIVRAAIVVMAAALLTGCPPAWTFHIRNASPEPIRVETSGGTLPIPAFDSLEMQDSALRTRSARGAASLQLTGTFGTSCHELVFDGLEADAQIDWGRHAAHLVVGPDGSVHAERRGRRSRVAADIAALPGLETCR